VHKSAYNSLIASLTQGDKMRFTHEELTERSKALFNSDLVSPETNHYNQKSWVESVNNLGDKWLYAAQVQRKDCVVKKGSK
jgi:hypothetical protein